MEMRYWVGATTCHTQFLLGGYSLGQPGVLMVPFSLERRPPHAAANTGRLETHEERAGKTPVKSKNVHVHAPDLDITHRAKPQRFS